MHTCTRWISTLALGLAAILILGACTRERPVDAPAPADTPEAQVEVQEPAVIRVNTPTPAPTDTPAPPTATPEPKTIPYEVRPGDTVSTIAEKFGTDSQTIREMNLLPSDDLRVGQVLRVPNIPGVTTPEGLPTPTPEPFRYVIQEGDTLLSIALEFGVSPNDIVAANVLADPDNLVVGQVLIIPGVARPGETAEGEAPGGAEASGGEASSGSEPGIHIVRQGEVLGSIAELYGVSVEALIAANGITNPDVLRPGDALLIPGLTAEEVKERNRIYYTVQPGDTLSSIAQRYGVSTQALMQANGIQNPNLLSVGTRLVIPEEEP